LITAPCRYIQCLYQGSVLTKPSSDRTCLYESPHGTSPRKSPSVRRDARAEHVLRPLCFDERWPFGHRNTISAAVDSKSDFSTHSPHQHLSVFMSSTPLSSLSRTLCCTEMPDIPQLAEHLRDTFGRHRRQTLQPLPTETTETVPSQHCSGSRTCSRHLARGAYSDQSAYRTKGCTALSGADERASRYRHRSTAPVLSPWKPLKP
jgi:hypothetical protein